jgi:hypothetical protein
LEIGGPGIAALPLGPQLNNYRELIEDIMKEDPSTAEPLTPEEKRILVRIAMKFPQERMVYNAVHRERARKGKAKGP